jgi:uncharacterized membrane protein HdeD (DUF308 family)
MESGRIPRLDPRASQQLAEGWKGLMVAGVLAMLVGCVAIIVPAAASVATAVFIGWILIFAGAFLVASLFGARSAGQRVARGIWALLTVVAGVYLISAPLEGTVTLTFVLVVYFIVMGLSRIVIALAARGQPNAGLVGLSGALSLIVGLLIGVNLPSSADWAIGLLVGIDLIFAGWSLASAALVGRDLAKSGAT